MTRDEIIRMAREAGLEQIVAVNNDGSRTVQIPNFDSIERFAALVAAAVREEMKWDGVHTCSDQCERPVCVAIREAVAREREECAKLIEQAQGWSIFINGWSEVKMGHNKKGAYIKRVDARNAIRARGQA